MIKTKNRHINTKIPAPGSTKILQNLSRYESRSMHGQMPIIWKKAVDYNIYDISNNKFIDFTSTIFVTNIGHSNKRLKRYLATAINKNLFHSYAYASEIREKYTKKLLSFAGKNFEKVFLLSAGTEATEAAFKLMRMHGQKINKSKKVIISFEGNWHGRTMGAQLMSGNEKQKEWIGYKDKFIYHLPFPYPWRIKNMKIEYFIEKSLNKLKKKFDLENEVCGAMIETFQGWGALYYPKDYIKKLCKILKKNKILITFDEMQSGFSRTGYNFGYEFYGVKPDLICCGKGMGGGVPISGVIGKKKIMDLPDVGSMSSTHSANPLSCYAGLAVIDEIEKKKITSQTKLKGKILFERLFFLKDQNKELIEYVSGKGLIAAIIFKKKKNINSMLKKVVFECMKNGLLVVYTGRESIKIGPPLTIPNHALKEGLDVLASSIKKVFKND